MAELARVTVADLIQQILACFVQRVAMGTVLAVRNQIASAIDLIVHMDRLTDGTRKVVRIAEVPRMEGDVVTLSDLFRYDQTGIDTDGKILGDMRATGLRPVFTPRLEVAGYKLRGEIFGG